MKKSFTFFYKWAECIKDYSSEIRLEIYEAIINYTQFQECKELSPMAQVIFNIIKKEIIEYQDLCKIRKACAKKGGNPNFKKGKSNPYYQNNEITKDNQTLPKITKDNQNYKPICNLLSTNNLQGENAEMQNFGENSDEKRKFSPYNPLYKENIYKEKNYNTKVLLKKESFEDDFGAISDTDEQAENTLFPLPPFPNEERKPAKKADFDFKAALLEIGVSEQTASDWLKVRRDGKGSNTLTAFNHIKKEIAKSGKSAEDCIRFSAERSYIGFEAQWLENLQRKSKKGGQNQNHLYRNAEQGEYTEEIY